MAALACLIRPIHDDERELQARLATASWGSPVVMSRGTAHDVRDLRCLVALDPDSERWLGVAAFRIDGAVCELVQIEAFERGSGVGTALLEAVCAAARSAGATRLWLVTTNDNLDALRFYQRRGLRLVRVWPDAVTKARLRKPEIPLTGEYGIPILDELELERNLEAPASPAE